MTDIIPMNGPVGRSVTVVIPTRDRPAALSACLDALFAHPITGIDLEVIVVDNSETGSAVGVVEAMIGFPSVLRVTHEPDRGLSKARNRGLADASGDVVAFIDDDCRIGDRYWRAVRFLTTDDDNDFWFGPITLGNPSDARIGVDEDLSDWTIADPMLARPGVAQGANVVVRSTFARTLAGYDIGLGAGTPFRCEDLDFLARALRSGGQGRHLPDLQVAHHHGRRRRSPSVLRIDIANSVAIGAFYAKQALAGDSRYPRAWLRNLLGFRGRYGWRLDLKGAQCVGLCLYLVLHGRRPTVPNRRGSRAHG